MENVEEFLSSEKKVFLLLGDSGAGKSSFNRELECHLWKSYKKGDVIPLHINLPAIEKPEHDMIAKRLRKAEFTEPQIKELKLHRKFILICDGYDESQQTQNLYTSNRLNQEGGLNARMVISCRSEHLRVDYRDRFQPGDRNRSSGPSSFQEAVITPFSMSQKCYRAWSIQDKTSQPLISHEWHDQFIEHWLERGKTRLGEKNLNPQTRSAFESLIDEGFTRNGIDYLKKLSVAIYKEQDGQPIVTYSRYKDENSWKAPFFNREEEKQILREACPLIRNGNQHRFIHRSLLEYGVTLAIFDPHDRNEMKAPSLETVEDSSCIGSGSAIEWEQKLQQAKDLIYEDMVASIVKNIHGRE
ncbi:MAG: hypothetical protein J3Q66DRAFT_398463 [Benniella sp.]|nr:MAG: hypothetical protein J3Q66DRAFT_398463 [Benniella sp.]